MMGKRMPRKDCDMTAVEAEEEETDFLAYLQSQKTRHTRIMDGRMFRYTNGRKSLHTHRVARSTRVLFTALPMGLIGSIGSIWTYLRRGMR